MKSLWHVPCFRFAALICAALIVSYSTKTSAQTCAAWYPSTQDEPSDCVGGEDENVSVTYFNPGACDGTGSGSTTFCVWGQAGCRSDSECAAAGFQSCLACTPPPLQAADGTEDPDDGSRSSSGNDPECTRPGCQCEGRAGRPVAVGSGRHWIAPIPLIEVDGPWRVPLLFQLHYTQTNNWGPNLNDTPGSIVRDPLFLRDHFSHTLSESIVVVQRQAGGVYRRIAPTAISSWNISGPLPRPAHFDQSGTTPLLQVFHRNERGETAEFFRDTDGGTTIATLDTALGGGWIQLSSHRDSTLRLRYRHDAGVIQEFQVLDLATSIRTTFDASGRITSKRAPVRSSIGTLTWFGWTVQYTGAGALYAIIHDSGQQIRHVANAAGWWGRLHLLGVGETTPTSANEVIDFSITPPAGVPALTSAARLDSWIRLSRVNRYWRFSFVGGPNDVLTSLTSPSGVVTEIAEHQAPNACSPGVTLRRRARAAESAEGRWEFRREGTSQAAAQLCAGASPAADPNRGHNPCPAGQFATLDIRQLQRDAANQVVSCSFNSSNAGGCATGFECSSAVIPVNGQPAAHRCARYTCSTPAADNPDQIVAVSGCASGTCGASMVWQTIDGGTGHQPIRRLRSKTTAGGVITTYIHDAIGRLVYRCIGDDNTNLAVPAPPTAGAYHLNCPANAEFDSWRYPNSGIDSEPRKFSPSEHRRRVYGIDVFRYTLNQQDPLTGDVRYTEVQAPTIDSVPAGVISGYPNVTQRRGVNFEYHGVTGALARVFTATDGMASSTSAEVVYEHYPASDPTNNRYRIQRARIAKSGSGAATQYLDVQWGGYSVLGTPLTETDETGRVNTASIDPTTWRLTSSQMAGRTYAYAYDDTAVGGGRLRSVTMPSGEGVVFEYSSTQEPPVRVHLTDNPTIVDASGMPNGADIVEQTQSPFDPVRVTSILRRIGGAAPSLAVETRRRRDDRARVAELLNIVNPSEITTIEYTPQGWLSKVTDASNNTTIFNYNPGDSRVQSIDRGRLIGGAFLLVQHTAIAYDVGLDVVRSVAVSGPDGLGQSISYVYNGFGELIQSNSSEAGLRQFVYDERGRLAAERESDSTTTAFTYDRAGRLLTISRDTGGAGPSYWRDNQRLYWDALPAGTACPSGAFCTNLVGRLAKVESDWVFGSFATVFSYTSQGDIESEAFSSFAGSNYVTRYAHDTAGRVTSVTFPMGTGDSARYAYGSTNSPSDSTLVTGVTAGYNGGDWLPLVTRVDRAAGGTIEKMWFNQGTATVNPSVERTFRMDGRLGAVRWRTGTNTWADLGDYSYEYHDNGNLRGIVNNSGGASSMATQRFAYDSLGRLTCSTTGADPNTNCTTANPTTTATYSYDNYNNRSQSFFRDPAGATHSHEFGYDAVGDHTRMQWWRRSEWPAVARVNLGYGSATAALGGPGHRASETRSAHGADPALGRYWAYYSGGRPALVSMVDARGTSYHYSGYDHTGRRRASYQFLPDGSTRYELYFYDQAGRLIGTTTNVQVGSTNTLTAQPIYWVDNEPVYRLSLNYVASGAYWSPVAGEFFYNDQTGTPRIAVNSFYASPTVTYRATNEPFLAGPARFEVAARPVQMRFPGQWEDRGSGFTLAGGSPLSSPMSALVANHARVYDPGAGAYGQREPKVSTAHWIGVEVVRPWYSYAGSDPVGLIDTNGESAAGVVFGVAIVGALLYPMFVDMYRVYSEDRTVLDPTEAMQVARRMVEMQQGDPRLTDAQRYLYASQTLTSVRRGTRQIDDPDVPDVLRAAAFGCRTQNEISDRLAPVAHYLEGAGYHDDAPAAAIPRALGAGIMRNNVATHIGSRGLGVGRTGPTEVGHASLFDTWLIFKGAVDR